MRLSCVVVSLLWPIACNAFVLDRPVQLVRPDATHENLEIVPEGLQMLKRIESTVAVIGVVGFYHSGKSFMLNQLARDQVDSGFALGPSVDPTTMGIWALGGEVITLKDGTQASVIYLDTEGFSSSNVTQHYDSKVFAVSALVSSYLLYNSVKIIDQAAIDYLELLARQTQMFSLKARLNASADFDTLFEFPDLMWVIQDFFQDTADETPTEWLHRMLNAHDAEDSHQNQLARLFPSIECRTLFLPSIKRDHLQDLSLASNDDLTDDYQADLAALQKAIANTLTAKTTYGKEPMTGAGLATLLQLVVNGTNLGGSLAKIPSLWQSFILTQKQAAENDCLQVYHRELDIRADQAVPEDVLEQRHTAAVQKALAVLRHLLLGFQTAVESSAKVLETKIETELTNVRIQNKKNIESEAKRHTHAVVSDVRRQLAALTVPCPSHDLKEFRVNITVAAITHFDTALKALKESGVVSSERDNLHHQIDHALLAKSKENDEKLLQVLQTARERAVRVFKAHLRNTDREVRSHDTMQQLKTEAAHMADNKFDEVAAVAKAEVIFGSFAAQMRELLSVEWAAAEAEQVQLVNVRLTHVREKLVSDFKQYVDMLILPMEEDEFHRVCDKELANVQSVFDDEALTFKTMGYSESVKLMKSAMTMELNAKYDEVQKRNIRAYSEIVDEPLQRIRPEIQLYAAEYTLRGMYPAVFKRAASARVYAEIERALSQLTAEGLPMGKRNWSHELKRRVADRYVDEKMSREIKQVQSRFYWLMITTIVTVLSGVFAHFQLKSR